MPRGPARPLGDLRVTGRPSHSDYRVLTPRTPHSRAGRAEDALTEVELDELRDGDANGYGSYKREQNKPLLAAGYRSDGDQSGASKGWRVLERSPLVAGSILACILLGLFAISVNRPGALEDILLPRPEVLDLASSAVQNDAVVTASAAPPTPSYKDTYPPTGRLISYENYTRFPLTGMEYRHECEKLMGGFMHHAGYWTPPKAGVMDVMHHDDVTDYHLPEGYETKVCSKTITYMLDGHVGLAADLGLMAQVAGLAREQGRTFLVDDTYWNRGKWTDYFQDVRGRQPGPEPGCRAPPPEELVACPRLARHWVINSRTAKYHLGHEFSEEYEDPYAHGLNRQKPIFDRSLASFTDTIRPNAHSAELIRKARSELASTLSVNVSDPDTHNPAPYIAVHIRRGDREAASWAYHGSQVPIENYVQSVIDTWTRLYPSTPIPSSEQISRTESVHFPVPPITWLASDSPDASRTFQDAFPASGAAIFSLASSTDAALRGVAPHHAYVQKEFVQEDEAERVRLTRGMIVDLAMVSGLWAWDGDVVPGAIVCTITSNVCRLSAVGLGWDRAFGYGDGGDYSMGWVNEGRKRWVEIDNKDQVTPIWTGFEVFR